MLRARRKDVTADPSSGGGKVMVGKEFKLSPT